MHCYSDDDFGRDSLQKRESSQQVMMIMNQSSLETPRDKPLQMRDSVTKVCQVYSSVFKTRSQDEKESLVDTKSTKSS